MKKMQSNCKIPSEFEVEDGMLMRYYGYDEVVEIPEGITDIFFEVFSRSTCLTKIIIPGSITDVTPLEFEGCNLLTEAVFKEGVVHVGICSFLDCPSLEVINLPKSLKSIGQKAFANCTALKEVRYKGSREDWEKVDKHPEWDIGAGKYILLCDYISN